MFISSLAGQKAQLHKSIKCLITSPITFLEWFGLTLKPTVVPAALGLGTTPLAAASSSQISLTELSHTEKMWVSMQQPTCGRLSSDPEAPVPQLPVNNCGMPIMMETLHSQTFQHLEGGASQPSSSSRAPTQFVESVWTRISILDLS